ncbi:hypothetical protein HK097_000887, partial [Rhizophlyctis rosea]
MLPKTLLPRLSNTTTTLLRTSTRQMSLIRENPAGESKHPRGGAGMASKEQQLDKQSTSGDRFARVPPGFEAKVDGKESHGHKYKYYELDVDDRKKRDAPGWDKVKGDNLGHDSTTGRKRETPRAR